MLRCRVEAGMAVGQQDRGLGVRRPDWDSTGRQGKGTGVVSTQCDSAQETDTVSE